MTTFVIPARIVKTTREMYVQSFSPGPHSRLTRTMVHSKAMTAQTMAQANNPLFVVSITLPVAFSGKLAIPREISNFRAFLLDGFQLRTKCG